MQLTIPLGSEIIRTETKTIKIRIPHSKFYVLGEQQPDYTWHAYILDPNTGYTEIMRKDITTKSFALFSNLILKTPFPYEGKKAENIIIIKKFLRKLIRKTKCKTTQH